MQFFSNKSKMASPISRTEDPRLREAEFSDVTCGSHNSREEDDGVNARTCVERKQGRQTEGIARYQVGSPGDEGNDDNRSKANEPNRKSNVNLFKRIEVLQSCIEMLGDKKSIVVFFLSVATLNWFFTILATAISQLDVVGGGCYSFWGMKNNCDTVSYTIRTQLLSCKEVRQRLQVGAAFSIFSILLMTAVLYLVFKTMMNQRLDAKHKRDVTGPTPSKWVIVGMAATAELCELVCWSMTVSIYSSRYCEDKTLPRTSTYGAGFGLLVTAWTLGAIALVVFIVLV